MIDKKKSISIPGNPKKVKVCLCRTCMHPMSIKLAIRDLAKTDPRYNETITFPNGHTAFGLSDSQNLIPVNTLGRWIFGVPGFKGQYQQRVKLNEEDNESLDVIISLPVIPEYSVFLKDLLEKFAAMDAILHAEIFIE